MAFHHTTTFWPPSWLPSQPLPNKTPFFIASHNTDHSLSLSLSLSNLHTVNLLSIAINKFAMNPTAGTQLILLLLIPHFIISPGRCHAVEMRPVESTHYQVVETEVVGNHTNHPDGRRKLAPFQLCLLCKCCAGGGGDPTTATCATMPCCFGIDCQLPNKPFGVCAFVPKTCNCTSCAA